MSFWKKYVEGITASGREDILPEVNDLRTEVNELRATVSTLKKQAHSLLRTFDEFYQTRKQEMDGDLAALFYRFPVAKKRMTVKGVLNALMDYFNLEVVGWEETEGGEIEVKVEQKLPRRTVGK